MSKAKYLHASYIVGTGDGYDYKSCLLAISNGDYNSLHETLKEDYCQKTGVSPNGLMLSILSLNEISKKTYKILNGGKL